MRHLDARIKNSCRSNKGVCLFKNSLVCSTLLILSSDICANVTMDVGVVVNHNYCRCYYVIDTVVVVTIAVVVIYTLSGGR